MATSGVISIEMTVSGAPRFAPDQVTAKAGTVVFFVQNVRGPTLPVGHDMVIGPKVYEGLARTPNIDADESVVFTVEGLTPGTYKFWCEVRQHAANGMVGTLTITP